MKLKYGNSEIELNLNPKIIWEELSCAQLPSLDNSEKAIIESLRKPVNSLPLIDKVKTGDTVCILVNDPTRLARSELFLPIIIKELVSSGVKINDIFIVFASGAHRPLKRNEMIEQVGEIVAKEIVMYNHDHTNADELIYGGNAI